MWGRKTSPWKVLLTLVSMRLVLSEGLRVAADDCFKTMQQAVALLRIDYAGVGIEVQVIEQQQHRESNMTTI